MKTAHRYLVTGAAVLTAVASSAALAQPAGGPGRGGPREGQRAPISTEERDQYKAYAVDNAQAKLNLTARQLGITTKQQSAWEAYSNAIKQMAAARFERQYPAPDADAAAIAKFRADMAADHAKRLAAVSEATSRLQATLTSEQQTEFNNMNRFGSRGGPGWGHGGGPRQGPNGGGGKHRGGGHWGMMGGGCPYF